MHCSRCQGLIVKNQFLDLDGDFGEMWAQSWRCVNCGHVHAPVIARNRLLPPAPVWGHSTGELAEAQDDTSLREEAFIRPTA
jgi:hypothetical protein